MTAQLSVFEFNNKEDVKKKSEALFVNRGYELIQNYYPNRFRDLEYKFKSEEIREETGESFRYHVVYVAGTEEGERSEIKL